MSTTTTCCIVTTDRLSAYDVVMPDPVPGKGEVLTKISLFWFRMMSDIIDNQLTDLTVSGRRSRTRNSSTS